MGLPKSASCDQCHGVFDPHVEGYSIERDHEKDLPEILICEKCLNKAKEELSNLMRQQEIDEREELRKQ